MRTDTLLVRADSIAYVVQPYHFKPVITQWQASTVVVSDPPVNPNNEAMGKLGITLLILGIWAGRLITKGLF